METLILILYYIANSALTCLLLGIFATIGIGVVSAASAKVRHRHNDKGQSVMSRLVKWLFRMLMLATLGLAILGLLSLIIPHAIDGPLIAHYGQRADAKVLDRIETYNLHNEQRVYRSNVIYKTEAGETIETYFETWDFNVYPSANSVRYPQPGQTFRVAYLPSRPQAFLILTDEKSEYQANQACVDALRNIEQKRNKHNFDKKDAKLQSEYALALAEGIKQQCGAGLIEELKSLQSVKTK